MKQYTLKTVNHEGNVLHETKLTLKEGSTLICQVTPEMPIQQIEHLHKMIESALNSNANLITIPDNVKLKVLEIE